MRSGDQWLVHKSTDDLPGKCSSSCLGRLYIVEYGNYVKIGRTKNINTRIKALRNQAEKYANKKLGKIAYTLPHTNFINNELLLHKYFQKQRINGAELFDISFAGALEIVPKLIFEDDSNERKKRADESAAWMWEYFIKL